MCSLLAISRKRRTFGLRLVIPASAADLDLVLLVIQRLNGIEIAASRPSAAQSARFGLVMMGSKGEVH